MAVKAFMMPHTVPKRPMKGAAEPTVARKPRRFSSVSLSRAMATSSTLSSRACTPMKLSRVLLVAALPFLHRRDEHGAKPERRAARDICW